MDCQKLNEIYLRSCNYTNSKMLEKSSIIDVQITYYKNSIQTKADANCLKAIKLLNSLKCNN